MWTYKESPKLRAQPMIELLKGYYRIFFGILTVLPNNRKQDKGGIERKECTKSGTPWCFDSNVCICDVLGNKGELGNQSLGSPHKMQLWSFIKVPWRNHPVDFE